MGSYISLTIPQAERSNSTYAQSNPRFKNNNFHTFLALSMEHFADVLSPFDVKIRVLNTTEDKNQGPVDVLASVNEVLKKTNQDQKKSHASTMGSGVNTEGNMNNGGGNMNNGGYNKPHRLSKDNLYMILALWMEDFVNKIPQLDEKETKESYRNVGAVLVSPPNDVILAADCSRDGVHAVQRLLMKHHDKVEGSKMFMSRKPCPVCAKLLVQAKVKRVLYLPIEPEYDLSPRREFDKSTSRRGRTAIEIFESNSRQKKQVDHMFNANPIAQTRLALHVPTHGGESCSNVTVSENQLTAKCKFTTREDLWLNAIKEDIKNFIELKDKMQVPEDKKEDFSEAMKTLANVKSMEELTTATKAIEEVKQAYFPENLGIFDEETQKIVGQFKRTIQWLPRVENDIKEELPWQEIDDKIKKEVEKNLEKALDWAKRVSDEFCSNYQFENFPKTTGFPLFQLLKSMKAKIRKRFYPVTRNSDHEKQAQHFMTMAKLLAKRTDDTTTGVGAVIISYPKMEIVAFGWNGYPFQAQYSEFSIASDKDKEIRDKKYPYVIHAEQSALLMRNTKNIQDSILFVTKTPCHECAPLIAMEGVKTVVKLADKKKTTENVALDYKMFPNMAENGTFTCYQTKTPE